MRGWIFGSVLAALLAGTPAVAQSPPLVGASFTGAYDGTKVTLQVWVQDVGLASEVAGIHVTRVDMGSCTNERQITLSPLPWQADRTITAELTDSDVSMDRGYQYQVWGVDANGDRLEIVWGWGDAIKAWIVIGDAPVAHGIVSNGANVPGMSIGTCAQECYPSGEVARIDGGGCALIEGTTILAHGYVISVHPQFGANIVLTSWRCVDCIVATDQSFWSDVKLLYR